MNIYLIQHFAVNRITRSEPSRRQGWEARPTFYPQAPSCGRMSMSQFKHQEITRPLRIICGKYGLTWANWACWRFWTVSPLVAWCIWVGFNWTCAGLDVSNSTEWITVSLMSIGEVQSNPVHTFIQVIVLTGWQDNRVSESQGAQWKYTEGFTERKT